MGRSCGWSDVASPDSKSDQAGGSDSLKHGTRKSVMKAMDRSSGVQVCNEFLSIAELAARWRCSRGTVYNRIRSKGIKVLDFAPRGRKGRKVVPVLAVLDIEAQSMKRFC